MQLLADDGVDIIAAQENADNDDWSPRGYKRWRPNRARSTTIYWNPKTVKATEMGHKRLSSVGFPSYRGLTFVIFQTDIGMLEVASVHLPAFKTSKPGHAKEYRKQEQKLARYLSGSTRRVVAGDINGQIPSKWTPNLSLSGRWSDPVPSGPRDSKIDYVGVTKTGPYKIVKTKLGDEKRSDHRPVIATLERR